MLFSNPATAGAMDWNWMWVRIHIVIVDWFGLGQSASGLCWIGFSHLLFHLSGFSKMDPCPTLLCASHSVNNTPLKRLALVARLPTCLRLFILYRMPVGIMG